MLLTGGVRTNIFKQGQAEIAVVVNDGESLQQARDFFNGLEEVESVTVA